MIVRIIPVREEAKKLAENFGVVLLPDMEVVAAFPDSSEELVSGLLTVRPSVLVENLYLSRSGGPSGRLTADALSYYALGYGRNWRILGPDGKFDPMRNAVFVVDRDNASVQRFLVERGVEFSEEQKSEKVGRIWVP